MGEWKLWKNKETGELDPYLFSKEADEFAKKINGEASRKTNNGSQLRKFFDEIVRLNTLAMSNDSDWKLILPQVHMVVAKVAYAKGRKLVSEKFVRHLRSGIEQVKDPEDLKILASYLEAFMGFYKSYNNK